ncbi:MAG: hypothetical protein IT290_01165 [Deltaproteobacteria bacterium]|nr:hypothetical protein [Deltaproteobacteria bacterium]
MLKKKLFRTLSVAALALCACSSGEDDVVLDGSDNGDDGSNSVAFTTECGVVTGGTLQNPVQSSDGERVVSGRVVSSNVVIINTGTGDQLVKLHGLAPADERREDQARTTLQSLLSGGSFFYRSTDTCSVTVDGGGVGTSGQILTVSGRSLTEEAIRSGYALNIDAGGSCGEELVAPCYNALVEEVKATLPRSAGQITDFLWKPEADGGYNNGLLVILVNPCDADVRVNGEPLENFGPGNGRCTTARSLTRSGCGYGGNIRVEVFAPGSGLPYEFPDGNLYYTIPNGCDRTEFRI